MGVPTSELIETLYRELHALARARMAQEGAGHTLQPTALVHEVFLRLSGEPRQTWSGSAEFFAAAAEGMRRVLIDHARARAAEKRGGGRKRASLTASNVGQMADEGNVEEIVALNDAIARVDSRDARMAQIVRLRVFGGLTNAQTAEIVGMSERTVKRDWALARAMLYDEMRVGRE